MKNVIKINFNNQAKVDLVTRLNTGTNEVWLSITGANNGVINLGENIIIPITSDNFNYEINSSLWVGDGQLEISVRNSSIMGFYRINKIDELTGDIYIQQDGPNLFTLVRGSNDGGLVHKDVEFEDWQQMTPEEQADGTEYFVWNGGSAKVPLDYFYPIGSIYMSVNNISPALLFGGTWEKIENKFLLGSGSEYGLGAEGGEATIDYTPAGSNSGGSVQGHKLTANESGVQSHAHTFQAKTSGSWSNVQWGPWYTAGSNRGGINWGLSGATGGVQITSTSKNAVDAHSHGFTNPTFSGSKATLNNMPPYLVVNIWVRVPDPEETSEG